jgi:hypothetical protein
MNTRPVDITKKSNIKCEHCRHYERDYPRCGLTHELKLYYHRCKKFEWEERYLRGADDGEMA